MGLTICGHDQFNGLFTTLRALFYNVFSMLLFRFVVPSTYMHFMPSAYPVWDAVGVEGAKL